MAVPEFADTHRSVSGDLLLLIRREFRQVLFVFVIAGRNGEIRPDEEFIHKPVEVLINSESDVSTVLEVGSKIDAFNSGLYLSITRLVVIRGRSKHQVMNRFTFSQHRQP